VTAINRGAAVAEDGMSVPIDERVVDVKTYQYDAYLFIGGEGARIYFDDEYVHKLANDVKYKTVAAIGNAAMILARTEVLKKKKVTCPPEYAGYVIEAGAEYTGTPLEVDEKVITLRDTSGTEQLANALAEAVE
jgi:protease I